MDQSNPIILVGGYDAVVVSSPIFNDQEAKNINIPIGTPQINRISISPNHDKIIAGNPSLFIINDSQYLTKCIGHQTNITDVFCIKSVIYTCSEDGTWRIWENSQCSKKVRTTSPLNSIQVTRNQVYVFVANERGEVELHDTKNGTHNYITLSDFPVRCIALSKDHKRLIAACHDGNVFILQIVFKKNEVDDTSQASLQEITHFKAHENVVLRCIISPDQETFITTSADSTAKIWDFKNYDLLHELKVSDQKNWVWDAAYTKDSKYVITGGTDSIIRTWDVNDGQMIFSKELSLKGITTIAIYYSSDYR